MDVPYAFLKRQFAEPDALLEALRPLVQAGEFTLGPRVDDFERRFAALHRHADGATPHAVGVGSGTDALALALEAVGVGPDDEVITSPTSFIATAGAIVMLGARPVFVDIDDRFLLDVERIEAAITPRTRAIVPVHYMGDMVDMAAVRAIADRHGLAVVEDACQAVLARWDGEPPGALSDAAAFSLHPLKNLHVWGDGGVVLTHRDAVDEAVRLQRNHGLVSRDEAAVFGRNSRLHTLQAAVGSLLIDGAARDLEARREIAAAYDDALADLAPVLQLPPRDPRSRHVYHLYVVQVMPAAGGAEDLSEGVTPCSRRDAVLAALRARGVSAKVHYPLPLHLQPAARSLGYRRGDFPRAEAFADRALTLPANPYLEPAERGHVLESLRGALDDVAARAATASVEPA
ncbi:MAG: DegT/DnrJ/EryC1/StrS family aminotransferase [Acidobacteriota bacterium]